jgi:hypothetical protein
MKRKIDVIDNSDTTEAFGQATNFQHGSLDAVPRRNVPRRSCLQPRLFEIRILDARNTGQIGKARSDKCVSGDECGEVLCKAATVEAISVNDPEPAGL